MRYVRKPGEPPYDIKLRRYVGGHRSAQPEQLKQVFTGIYATNKWESTETSSGSGSERPRMKNVRLGFERLTDELMIRSVLDAPCGDFNWMKDANLSGIDYVGGDIVEQLVGFNVHRYGSPARRFTVLDITRDSLPKVDLILCRDALVHFSDLHAAQAIQNFKKSGSKYLLTTTFTDTENNFDIITGWWRPLNLREAPFNFPPPLMTISDTDSDDFYDDKVLALWRSEDIS